VPSNGDIVSPAEDSKARVESAVVGAILPPSM
jgi:hypothetical protein